MSTWTGQCGKAHWLEMSVAKLPDDPPSMAGGHCSSLSRTQREFTSFCRWKSTEKLLVPNGLTTWLYYESIDMRGTLKIYISVCLPGTWSDAFPTPHSFQKPSLFLLSSPLLLSCHVPSVDALSVSKVCLAFCPRCGDEGIGS